MVAIDSREAGRDREGTYVVMGSGRASVRPAVPNSDDSMAAVRHYVDAFNNGEEKSMAAACADPMQILDGMSPHVWQGTTAVAGPR